MADAAATGGPARWWNLKQLTFKCWSHDTYDGRWSHPMCWMNWCSVVSWNHLISYFSSECAWLATVWNIFLVWILYVAGPLSYVACLGCSPCLGSHRSIHELTDASTHFSQWSWLSLLLGLWDWRSWLTTGLQSTERWYFNGFPEKPILFLWKAGVLNSIG